MNEHMSDHGQIEQEHLNTSMHVLVSFEDELKPMQELGTHTIQLFHNVQITNLETQSSD